VRHGKSGKKLNRHPKARKALIKNLLTDFFLHEALVTTEAKAKLIKGKIDRLISKAKNPSLANRRFIYHYLTKFSAARKLIDEIAPQFSDRNSGYSRILKLGTRLGDRAAKARIELVAFSKKPEPKETGAGKRKPASKKKTTSSRTTVGKGLKTNQKKK
jgi:large subunit ribosomal protein L17